jgi:hypothetical protein
VQQNSVDSPLDSEIDGYGGGIWVQTSGPGDEIFTIDHNTVVRPWGSTTTRS